MKKIAGRLVGSPQQFPFEQRIFHFTMLLGIFMTAFGALMDLYYGDNLFFDLLFTGIWTLTYSFSRFKGYFRIASRIGFTVLILVFLPYQWLMNGGIMGGFPYYAIIILDIVCIVLSGRSRVFAISALFAAMLPLIVLDALKANPAGIVINLAVQLLIVMAATAVFLIVFSNIYMREKARAEAYGKALEQNYRQQLYYMETLEDLIGRLKSERHDFNHHLGVMYALLEDSESERARAYAAKLVDDAREYRSMVSIPYSMLRAMLNYKLSAAREREITLQLDIRLPAGLKLNEADLTVILGNLIDNAMEACEKVEKENRYIALNISYKPDYLVIQAENPAGEKALAGGMGRSTKPDSENHGFGLRNIEYLVQKHSGIMKLTPEPGVFKISLALLVEE